MQWFSKYSKVPFFRASFICIKIKYMLRWSFAFTSWGLFLHLLTKRTCACGLKVYMIPSMKTLEVILQIYIIYRETRPKNMKCTDPMSYCWWLIWFWKLDFLTVGLGFICYTLILPIGKKQTGTWQVLKQYNRTPWVSSPGCFRYILADKLLF